MEELIRYAIVDETGHIYHMFKREEDAKNSKLLSISGCVVVKMTGILSKEKVIKRVAKFMYRSYRTGRQCLHHTPATREEAEQVCFDIEGKLIHWPYGEITEVEE